MNRVPVLPVLAGLLLAYLLVPIVAFAVRLAGAGGAPAAPGVGAALATSLVTATISTAVIGVLGIPLGYLLARRRGRVAAALGVLVQLPLALPPLISGVLLVYLVGPYAPLGELTGGQLTDTRIGIVLAQVFVAAPFLVVAARSAFAAVDPALLDVAATLGHGRLSRFVRVALPVAGGGIRAGLLLSWLRAFGEFGATVILAYHPYTLPVFTYVQFGSTGLPATVLPVAVALLAALLILGAADHLRLPRRRGRAVLPGPVRPNGRPGPLVGFDLAARVGGFVLSVAHPPGARTIAILGPSGAGKSMTLRALAGLLPARGDVTLTGDGGRERLAGLAPEHRGIGYLPQDPALLPQLTVWRQVLFGVGADPAVAAYWLDRLGLTELADRRPDQLSGGQRRRVALARALARRPRLLLLDEPFAGLDTPVRDELRHELRALQRDTGMATVLVTHDPDEAALLADEVLLLSAGTVRQQGRQEQVYAHPCDPRAARLLGIRNLTAGTVGAGGVLRCGAAAVCDTDLPAGTDVTWCVRPDQIALSTVGDGDGLSGRVVDVVWLAAFTETVVELPTGDRLTATRTGPAPEPGTPVRLAIPPDAVTLWPAAQ
jgi:molybdate transport system permease protein